MTATQTYLSQIQHDHHHRVAPWWLGFLFISPLRRLTQHPDRMLANLVTTGDRVVDVGPGMGYFTLPLAEMVGPDGQVVAVDCQQQMLDHLARRAAGQGLSSRVDVRRCHAGSLGIEDLAGTVDLVLAFNVVHEADDPGRMIGEMARALRPGGTLVLSEPAGHVSRKLFDRERDFCRDAGLASIATPHWRRQMTAVMAKSDRRP